jgi:hypothetical protein
MSSQMKTILAETQNVTEAVYKKEKDDVLRGKKNNYIVKFKVLGKGQAEVSKKNKQFEEISFNRMPRTVVVSLTAQEAESLRNDPNVEYFEVDHPVYKMSELVPDSMTQVGSTSAHGLGFIGNGVKVAIFDSGIVTDSPELNVAGGISFVPSEPYLDDENGHGTHVASILAAKNNGIGLLGIAPAIELYSVKVLDKTGVGSYSQVIQAINWAIENNIDIVAMSFAGDQYSRALEEAMQLAYENGILLVASVGNGASKVRYPAKYSPVIGVGAVDQNYEVASFSNRGQEVELVAPGIGIKGLSLSGEIVEQSGTSMAVPHVVGIAALAMERYPNYNMAQIRSLLSASALPLGDHNLYGNGLVNANGTINNYDIEDEIGINQIYSDEGADEASYSIYSMSNDTYEPNNGWSTAYLLSPGQTIQSYISTSTDRDYYKFTANQAGRITITLKVPEGRSSNFKVYDINTRQVAITTSAATQTVNFAFDANTTWYIRVEYGGPYVAEPYTLSLSTIIPVQDSYEPNDTQGWAYPISIGSQFSSNISSQGDVDYYRFTADRTGYIYIEYKYPNSVQGGEIKLYDDYNGRIGGPNSRDITAQVVEGRNYYIRVTNDVFTYRYTLTLSNIDSYEPNDWPDVAYSMAPGSTINSMIFRNVDRDYYKFTVEKTGIADINLNVPFNYDFNLYVGDNVRDIASSTNGVGQSETISLPVTPGLIYYIRVEGDYSSFGPENYNLSITVDYYEPNNSIGTAYTINENTLYETYISNALDEDYYKFTAEDTGWYHITVIKPHEKNYDVTLYDSNLNVIGNGSQLPGTNEEISFYVKSGETYFIKVNGVDGDHSSRDPYSFQLSKFITEYEYNNAGYLLTATVQRGMYLYRTYYMYDEKGNLLRKQTTRETRP